MAVVYLPQQSLDQEQVAELAYQLWEKRNRPHGAATDDWLEAERLLRDTEKRTEEQADEQADHREVTHQAA